MKNNYIICMLCFALMSCSNLQEKKDIVSVNQTKPGDFYNLPWGINKQNAITLVGKPKNESNEDLFYIDQEISGLKCSVWCWFINDSLSYGKYAFYKLDAGMPQKYITEYDRLKNLLIDKYGNPSKDTVKTSNSTVRANKQHFGTALFLGDLALMTTWWTPNSVIALQLKNVSSDGLNFEIYYYDRSKFLTILRSSQSDQGKGL